MNTDAGTNSAAPAFPLQVARCAVTCHMPGLVIATRQKAGCNPSQSTRIIGRCGIEMKSPGIGTLKYGEWVEPPAEYCFVCLSTSESKKKPKPWQNISDADVACFLRELPKQVFLRHLCRPMRLRHTLVSSSFVLYRGSRRGDLWLQVTDGSSELAAFVNWWYTSSYAIP
jgi:hypothetical protein